MEREVYDATREKLNSIKEELGLHIRDLRYVISKEAHKERTEEIKNTIRKHRDLVGKCFRSEKREFSPYDHTVYCKVISECAEDEAKVTCLVYDAVPIIRYKRREYALEPRAGGEYLGKIEFQSFRTDSIFVMDIEKMTPISPEEYNSAAASFFEEMLNKKNWDAGALKVD